MPAWVTISLEALFWILLAIVAGRVIDRVLRDDEPGITYFVVEKVMLGLLWGFYWSAEAVIFVLSAGRSRRKRSADLPANNS